MAFATRIKDSSDFKAFPRGLKDGITRCRVLPGIHSSAEDGSWCKKYNTHTYAVPREDDPEKKDYFTFNCVEVVEWANREKVVLETCPEHNLIADQDATFKKLQVSLMEDLKAEKRSKDECRKLLRPFIDWKKRHSSSFWWAVNVVDSEGKYHTEKWPNDVKKLFDALKKKLKDEEGIGAILPIEEGVWIDIDKTPGDKSGTGFPKYEVRVVMEKLESGGKKEKLAPLAPDAYIEAEKCCWDINDPGIITLTRDQVKRLAESGDNAAVVRAIFNQSTRNTALDGKQNQDNQSTKVKEPEPKPQPKPNPESDVHVAVSPEAVEEVLSAPASKAELPEDEILRKAVAALEEAKARREAARKASLGTPVAALEVKAEPKVEVKPEPKPEPKPEAKNDDGDLDSFRKEFGLDE